MKNLIILFWGVLGLSLLFSGCETFLDVDSNRLVLPGEHELDSPNDTIYSMVGIFSQLEKLSDRYVLLGELRGDLMDITENTNPDLREIYNFEISPDNPYNKKSDYYTVINNCNYLIQNIDTSIVAKAEKVMYKEFAAAKVIRAWTYMQLALNYGEVKYSVEPVLAIQDSGNYEVYTMQELIPMLIQDLEPWKNIEEPGSYSLGEYLSSKKSFFPIRFVLGDLYLWNGDYEKAAIEYYNLMAENFYVINNWFTSTWTVENGVFVSRELEDQDWMFMFSLNTNEQITLISGSTEYGSSSKLDSLSTYQQITPSTTAINNWNNQTYYYSASAFTEGDLRGDFGSYISPESFIYFGINLDDDFTTNTIMKFSFMTTTTSKAIAIYRSGLLYLRYAEAVNRAGKPNLAFAVLKHGLNAETLAVDTLVPKHEKYSMYSDSTGTFIDYVDFDEIDFDNNIGVHSRGCGNINLASDFRIPASSSTQDSILYVEDKIIEELALETAFEGNRFHDLMRIAIRRNNNSYLANKVAEKYNSNKEVIRNKLLDENNWYLP